jgi:L-amino acid N-acyltransferase YncA
MIRPAEIQDLERVWQLFKAIIDEGVYFAYDHTTTREQIEASWVNLRNLVYVAEEEGQIVGAYIVKPNQPGHGAHIANAAYMVDVAWRGSGVGRQLGAHSLLIAKDAGYHGMQYNMVVSSNKGAVHLWQSLGFDIIGTVPGGFHHAGEGYVDAYIMFKKL